MKPDYMRAQLAANDLAASCAQLIAFAIARVESKYTSEYAHKDACIALEKAALALGYEITPIEDNA